MTIHVLPSNGKEGVQVFTPTSIQTIAPAGSLDTTSIDVIRLSAPTDYQINGVGDVATMPVGSTGIHKSVTSIKFVSAAVVEVM
jgi:hypothetical protein